MLLINDLANGMVILIQGNPYQVLEVKHLHMGRGGSSVQTRIKNLRTGQVFSRNYKPADSFENADIKKQKMIFLYVHRGEYVFIEKNNPKNRFSLRENAVAEIKKWLIPKSETEAVFLGDELITITVPIKMDFKVIEAPPGLKGDTAQGGTKMVTLETGTKISAPLFINEGDIVRVNTQSGEYGERVEKK